MILMADEILGAIPGQRQDMLGGLHVTVERNFFGSQLGSFFSNLIKLDKQSNDDEYKAIFIRAPIVVKYDEALCKPIAKVHFVPTSQESKSTQEQDVVVAIQQGNLIGTSFHPELNPEDERWHERFVKLVIVHKKQQHPTVLL